MASRTVSGMGMIAAAAVVVVGMVMVVGMSGVEGAINCNTVESNLMGCVGYLTSGAGTPSPNCCAGVKTLAAETATTADRRTACACLKQASTRIPNVKAAAVTALPGLCGVKLSFKVATNTNCNTIM